MSTSRCQGECQSFGANQDVLGIGVRVNFYYTMLILAIIPRTPNTEEMLDSLYSNAGIAGFGLLLTAIIQSALNELSLFDALFILHILFFLGTGASPMSKYHWSRSRIAMGVFVQFASVITFTGWALYVWVHVKDYGNPCECNDQIKYVVLFFTVRATAPWLRVLSIVAIVVSAVGLMLSFGAKAILLFTVKRTKEEEEAEETNLPAQRSIQTKTPGTSLQAETEAKTEASEKQWYFQISIPLLLSAIYATTMLELTVRRNEVGTESGVVIVNNSWAFGQVLSVVMILANLIDAFHFLVGFFARRRLRRRLSFARQRQAEEAAYQAEEHSAAIEHQSRGSSGYHASSRDLPQENPSSGYELQNLDNGNAEVPETIVDPNAQLRDQLFGRLR
ncbi:hypothetical protein BJV74DRAFT_881105 [Russula compacta]|nr:hypothetical protein BJV74DRAFT_881105 [Russula compacta]